jgi:hypothetical protein
MHSLPQPTLKIKTVANLSREEFDELYRNKKPVIITELTANWPLFVDGNAMDSKESLKECFQQNLEVCGLY